MPRAGDDDGALRAVRPYHDTRSPAPGRGRARARIGQCGLAGPHGRPCRRRAAARRRRTGRAPRTRSTPSHALGLRIQVAHDAVAVHREHPLDDAAAAPPAPRPPAVAASRWSRPGCAACLPWSARARPSLARRPRGMDVEISPRPRRFAADASSSSGPDDATRQEPRRERRQRCRGRARVQARRFTNRIHGRVHPGNRQARLDQPDALARGSDRPACSRRTRPRVNALGGGRARRECRRVHGLERRVHAVQPFRQAHAAGPR